jgi:hypothetical protein
MSFTFLVDVSGFGDIFHIHPHGSSKIHPQLFCSRSKKNSRQ